MASMLVRVAFDASDAARLAAAAASRAARLAAAPASRSAAASRAARSAARAARSAAAAASRAARSGPCVTCPPRSGPSKRRDDAPSLPYDPMPGRDVTEKDLESDEAIWALYERWCKALNKERENGEMARRFNRFKQSAEVVHCLNNAYKGERRVLGYFADGVDMQDKRIDEWRRQQVV